MLNAIDISTTGIVAQRQRMNTIAGNIANTHTTRNADGEIEPFQRRLVRFSTADVDPQDGLQAAGVQFQIDVDADTPARRVLEPGHPDADADGYVSYPGINPVTEFVNALEASRAYEANVAALEITKEMASQSLQILA